MYQLHPFFAFIVFLIAVITIKVFRLNNKVQVLNRYRAIDGLRGCLGISVFIHHTSIWPLYLKTGVWTAPPSNFYNLLGQGAVSLFFMITAFLFISKLLDSEERSINWKNYFLSRVFRLMPMYYVSLAAIIIIVLSINKWNLNTSFLKFSESILNWLLFTVNKSPEINATPLTHIVNAGVVWSLPYEWLFYFTLPLISCLVLKVKPGISFLVTCSLFVIIFLIIHPVKLVWIYSFLGGSIAPFLLRRKNFLLKIGQIPAGITMLICLFFFIQFPSLNVINVLLLSIVFTLIALGKTLFGLFNSNTLKLLSDISYSTYLLHGIILFAVFYFGIGLKGVGELSSLHYCALILILTPIVVIVSFFGYYLIEEPFIRRGKSVIATSNNKK